MTNFPREKQMQREFFVRQDKIFRKYFPGYEIYGDNCEGHQKIGKKEIDFLLQHKTEKNKFKIVELKKEKKGCGVFGQILMYVRLVKEKFGKEAEISIEIIAKDIDGDLIDTVLASGSKIEIKYIKDKNTKREDMIKEKFGNDYDIEYDPKEKRIIKLKKKNELLVVWEETRKDGAGFYSFDRLLSYIYKYRKTAKEISGIIICKEPDSEQGRKNKEKLPLTIRGNEIMKEKNIKVRFWKYNYDEKEIGLEPISPKKRQ